MSSKAAVITSIAVLVAVLVGIIVYQNRQLANEKLSAVNTTRETFEHAIRYADSLATARKDSVIIIERKARDVTKRSENQVGIVRNTRSVDSLVVLYYRYRANPGSRFVNGGN